MLKEGISRLSLKLSLGLFYVCTSCRSMCILLTFCHVCPFLHMTNDAVWVVLDDHCALKCCLRHHNGFNACQDPATKNQYQKCIGPYLDQTAEEATSANEEPAEAEEPAAAEVEEPAEAEEPVAEVEEPATEVEEPAEPADDEQPEDANVEQPENVKYPAGYMVAPPPAGEPYRDWVWKDLDPVQQMYDGIPQCRNDNHCATKCCIR